MKFVENISYGSEKSCFEDESKGISVAHRNFGRIGRLVITHRSGEGEKIMGRIFEIIDECVWSLWAILSDYDL